MFNIDKEQVSEMVKNFMDDDGLSLQVRAEADVLAAIMANVPEVIGKNEDERVVVMLSCESGLEYAEFKLTTANLAEHGVKLSRYYESVEPDHFRLDSEQMDMLVSGWLAFRMAREVKRARAKAEEATLLASLQARALLLGGTIVAVKDGFDQERFTLKFEADSRWHWHTTWNTYLSRIAEELSKIEEVQVLEVRAAALGAKLVFDVGMYHLQFPPDSRWHAYGNVNADVECIGQFLSEIEQVAQSPDVQSPDVDAPTQ